MDLLELEVLLVKHRLDSGPLSGGDIGKVLVVTFGLAVGVLVLLPEMTPA